MHACFGHMYGWTEEDVSTWKLLASWVRTSGLLVNVYRKHVDPS